MTMWRAAPSSWCWTSRATETPCGASRSATCASTPGGRRPRAGRRTASAARRAAAARASRQHASFCRKPVPVVPMHADHVGDDRGGGLDAAGAGALERDLADRVALEHDRVERALDRGERMVAVDERRMDADVDVAVDERRRADQPDDRCRSRARPRRAAGVIALDALVLDVGERRRASRTRPSRGSPSSPPRPRRRRPRSDRPPRSRAAAPRRAPPRSRRPPPSRVRMKFVVPLTIPSIRWTFVTTSDSRSTLITGIAAQTEASKRSWTPAADAAREQLGSAPRDQLLVRRDDRLAGAQQVEDVARRSARRRPSPRRRPRSSGRRGSSAKSVSSGRRVAAAKLALLRPGRGRAPSRRGAGGPSRARCRRRSRRAGG